MNYKTEPMLLGGLNLSIANKPILEPNIDK